MNFKKGKYYTCLTDIVDNGQTIFNKDKEYLCIVNNILLGENYTEFCFAGERESLKDSFDEARDTNFDNLYEIVKDIQKKVDYLIKIM